MSSRWSKRINYLQLPESAHNTLWCAKYAGSDMRRESFVQQTASRASDKWMSTRIRASTDGQRGLKWYAGRKYGKMVTEKRDVYQCRSSQWWLEGGQSLRGNDTFRKVPPFSRTQPNRVNTRSLHSAYSLLLLACWDPPCDTSGLNGLKLLLSSCDLWLRC